MKYLVTGAAGFIGAKVSEFLLQQGHEVIGIDNLNGYYDLRIKLARLRHLCGVASCPDKFSRAYGEDALDRPWTEASLPRRNLAGQGLSFLHLDIENLDALDKVFGAHRFDAVINLAARAGVRYSMDNPHVYLSTNTAGTLNLLECQRKYKVPKHVLASTSSLYAGCAMPFTEDLPVNTPLSPYAATKKAAELLAYSYHKLFGLDVSVVRYFTVFGPAGRPDMSVFRFIKWIDEEKPIELFGDGSQSRDFTYVDDVARGTILATRPLGYEIINLGGGRNPISLQTMIRFLEQALGKKARINDAPFHAADVRETWADITKAGRLLGWRPEISPEEGFQRAIQWHRDNRAWIANVNL